VTHRLRSYPAYFQATVAGNKTHELRRETETVDVVVGDTIILEEFDPARLRYTGRTCEVEVTFISPSPKPWLVAGYKLMSTRLKRGVKWHRRIFPLFKWRYVRWD
jgi:hypothetical protein